MNRANRPQQPRISGSSYASRALSRAGDGSTLSLDFTTGVLDPRLTFSRAGGGTYVGPDGYIYGIDNATSSSLAIGTGSKSVTLTATAGVNRRFEVGQTVYFSNGANNMSGLVTAYSPATQVITINATSSSGSGSFTSWFVGNASARFDYDPTTLTPRGLLIEGSASNLVLQSDALPTPTNWVANSIVRTNVSAVTPDGNTTATTCGLSHTGSGSFRSQALTVVASTTYTFSFWAKNNGGSVALYRAYNVSGSADIVAETSYFTQINSSTWTRVRFTFTTPVGCTSVYVYPLSQSSGTSNLLIWGAQLEAGNGASSYIPTGASQGTREADSAVMNDIAPLNYSATNGSIYWSGIINKQPTSYTTHVGFMTAIDQPAYETFGNALNYFTTARGPTLNGGGANEVSLAYVLGSLIKYASSVDTLVNPIVAVNLNGSASSTTKSGTGNMHVATRFVLGRQPSSTYGVYYPSVTIRSIKYWPTTKTAAELAVLTA
jgi:hypothetical protein